MPIPIVAIISSYKEGSLIQGAIRSCLKAADRVYVVEGPIADVEIEEADETDIGSYGRSISRYSGEWESLSDKYNWIRNRIRQQYSSEWWTLIVDADEILVWGEYLRDWLNQLRPGHPFSSENVVPIKLTENVRFQDDLVEIEQDGRKFEVVTRSGGDPRTWLTPSRLVHSSLIERYEISYWHIRTPEGNYGSLNHTGLGTEPPPMFGEPHIHHRAYLRRPERKVLRLHESELKWIEDFKQKMADAGTPVPWVKDVYAENTEW